MLYIYAAPRADSMGGCISVLAHKHTKHYATKITNIMRQMPSRQVEAWRLATTAD